MGQGIRILGIDPGSHRLGFGLIEKSTARLTLLTAEVAVGKSKAGLFDRLSGIGARLEQLLDQWQPHEVAIEDVFYAKNARSAFQLGIARGVAIGACLRRQIPIFEYTPTRVKSVVAGSGRADKIQMKKMVELIIKARINLPFDATDAVGVAICHSFTSRALLALEKKTTSKSLPGEAS